MPCWIRGPCKHKQLVANHSNLVCADVIPDQDPRVHALYHYLATGKSKDAYWFRSLNDNRVVEMPSSSKVHNIFASMREDGATTSQTPQVVDEVAMCSDEDNMEVEEEEDDVDCGELVEIFEGALTHFKEEVVRRIQDDPKSYSKCVKSFSKQGQ